MEANGPDNATKEIITGREALMRALESEGVKTIFGYPGGSIMPVYDSLYEYTQGERKVFNHILVRHEQGAVHAAQGYARVSGDVGVAIVTSGPGATNTLTGVADAMLDSTPLVVIAGQVGIAALGTDAFQEVDLVGVAQPISKWSYQIRHADDVAWAVSRAFYIARSGRPGPVVLDFPKNAQEHTCEWTGPKHVDFVRSYVPYPAPDADAIAEAARLLNESKRPLALVGQGVELAGAHNELLELIEKADIPAGRTLLGLSALSSRHPLNKGMLGMHGQYAVNMKTQEADVIIAIGMRFSDRVTGLPSAYAPQAKIIHLDIDKAEIGKCIKADVAVIGDCKVTMPAITRLLKKNSHREWIDSFDDFARMEQEQVVEPAIHPKEGPLLMGEVVNVVAEATKGDAILVTDVGQNQMLSARYFHYNKKRSIVTSGGLGTMGFGMPAAIGATFGAPDRTVCMFCGDGGFQMNLQELGTIMEQQAPVKMILLNNNYLGNVRQWQDMFWGGRRSFTPMMNPRYDLIAQAYHIPYDLATDRSQLAAQVEKMLSTDGPYILECAIKEDANVMPMTAPGKRVDEMMLSVRGK
ncbi:MAG: biosynthetic-type acetolactate synthase large subunit [Prevotella sp.]|nr:biosynthetic-type acetolactate synthase large subunit [Prevotella sp.]